MSMNIYHEHVLEHARNPKNKKALKAYDIKKDGSNPSCGDELILYIAFDKKGRISDVGFDGEGCAISQAGASVVSEYIKGMTRAEIKKILPEKVYELLGVIPTPARQKCALLFYDTLKESLL